VELDDPAAAAAASPGDPDATHDADPGQTAVDPEPDPDPEELGTQAASPHALAVAGAPPGSQAQTGYSEAKPSAWATASARTLPTAAQALDKSDLPRMRMFHLFCVFAPLGAMALSFALGGDPAARAIFWAGALALAATSAGLYWLSGSEARWRPRPVGALWVLATASVLPAVYYFGPFSAVVMVQMLGIVFIALGRSRWLAVATTAICIVGQAAIAAPIVLGLQPDVGVLSVPLADTQQLAIAEILIAGFQISAYALGRWARHTSAAAVAELHRAMRVIGDQQQALAEVKAEHARQNRHNEGRWTGQTMGSFKLGLVLGRGAMGEVYEGIAGDGRIAAVKLLNARSSDSTSLVERFHREMAVAARLESPHIVRVYELSSPGAPVPYIAMERLSGTDLGARLRAETRLPSDELVVLLDQVGRALEIARAAGVVHRDLKPHNLFLHDGGTWKVLDFGVSKLAGVEGTLTGEGIVGTPQYMAPEQASGGQVTHAADVYALGAIAYRCLTGRAPFKGQNLSELVYQVVHTAPVRPSHLSRVPQSVEDVLAVAMAKDPKRRFPSAVAFAQAFVAARRGRAESIDPPANAWT
jgi:serine/threonine-protein kinase